MRGAVKNTGLAGYAVRLILKNEPEKQPHRKIKAQLAQPNNATKRLDMRRKWDAQIESGEIALEKIFITDEKIFRIWKGPGGNNNLDGYFVGGPSKCETGNDLILRDDDAAFQGGCSSMVSPGVFYRANRAVRFTPAGAKIASSEYIDILRNTYLPDCHHYYGAPNDCVSQ